ncbi:e9824fff-0a52-4d61-acc3-18a5a8cd0981 [Thermothielavioides terrestris]|uniref:E9824fff-0a52-4d61-acc3-18a5a8cd0981 n=1 Tax=Thermothielavioides terrestris TaxID=2587410 RepID=A0A446BUH2_9PEZI|nr:e9824fff-0a52-4d61-acc3-18a5a8cd0981 [Thermothielavioides terrestris]
MDNLKVALPKELYNFANLFDKEKANDLPPY